MYTFENLLQLLLNINILINSIQLITVNLATAQGLNDSNDKLALREATSSLTRTNQAGWIVEDAPFIAGIYEYNQRRCIGAIVHEQFVATSTRCCNEAKIRSHPIYAKVGSTDERHSVRIKTILYIGYSTFVDLCLMKLTKPLKWTTSIKSLDLPQQSLKHLDTVFLYDWGRSQFSHHLKRIHLHYIERNICQKQFPTTLVNLYKICGGNKDYEKYVCNIEYGAPIIVNNTLYGLASWNLDCNASTFQQPLVFTNVFRVKGHILNIIAKFKDKHLIT